MTVLVQGTSPLSCSPWKDLQWRVGNTVSGIEGTRTPNPLLAKQMLYQLSYDPVKWRRRESNPPNFLAREVRRRWNMRPQMAMLHH